MSPPAAQTSQEPPENAGGPPLLIASCVWAVLAWCLALLAPRMAFWPLVETLHITLPTVTFVLILWNLVTALRLLWQGSKPLNLLVNTTVQLLLFTLLFFQIAAHLGAVHYRLEQPPSVWDWFGFSLAHAARATDVFDTIEAYGLRIQVIRHSGWLVGTLLVVYHLIVNIFVLSVLWTIWANLRRWMLADETRREKVVGLMVLSLLVWLIAWAVTVFWLRPWNQQDIPWWLAENLLRVVDCMDSIDCFQVRLHQIPHEPWEGTLTFLCRLYLALGVGLLVSALTRWWMGGEGETSASVGSGGWAILTSLGLALCVGGFWVGTTELISMNAPLPELVQTVQQGEEGNCKQALAALRRLGVNAVGCAVPLTQVVLTRTDVNRLELTRTLGHLGPDSASCLVRLALDSEEPLARVAVESLRQIGPGAAPELVRVWSLNPEGAVGRHAEQCLRTLGVEAVPVLMETATRETLAGHLHWIRSWDRNWTLRSTPNELMQKAQELPALVRQISDPNSFAGWRAPESLGKLGPAASEAVPALTRLLGNKHRSVRMSSAEALGKIGPKAREAVPALARCLTDKVSEVREKAAKALGEIGPETREAVPALLDYLAFHHDPNAAWALGRVKPAATEAIPVLIKKLTYPNSSLMEKAAWALGEMGPAALEAVPALIHNLGDDYSSVGDSAAEALAHIGAAAVPALVRQMDSKEGRIWQRTRASFAKMGSAPVPVLVEYLSNPSASVRANAAEALEYVGPPARGALTVLKERLTLETDDRVQDRIRFAIKKVEGR